MYLYNGEAIIMNDNWNESYLHRCEMYDLFSQYEDYRENVWNKILELTNMRGKIVFEMGCGTGKYTKLLAQNARFVYANDISTAMVEFAKQKCSSFSNIFYVNSSAENVPDIPDKSVDLIFSAWGYVSTPPIARRVEKEFQRIIKRNGEIWLIDNYFDGEFTEMRQKHTDGEQMCLITQYGYELISVVETAFEFPDLDIAKQVCGSIFGCKAEVFFDNKGIPVLEDKVAILHKKGVN